MGNQFDRIGQAAAPSRYGYGNQGYGGRGFGSFSARSSDGFEGGSGSQGYGGDSGAGNLRFEARGVGHSYYDYRRSDSGVEQPFARREPVPPPGPPGTRDANLRQVSAGPPALDERAPLHLDQGFRPVVGQRAHARAQPRGQHHRARDRRFRRHESPRAQRNIPGPTYQDLRAPQRIARKPRRGLALHQQARQSRTQIRRRVGGPEVMRAQIDRLLEATKLPNVTLQVAPFENGPHPGTYGPFVLFRFAVPELPDMVYSEYLTGAVYLDARAEVATHLEVMDRMAAQAATAHRTKEILRDLRKEL